MEGDADLYMFYFYIPVDYHRLRAEVFGFFLTADNMYNMTLMPPIGQDTFDRATVVQAYFYHLQAEHTYTVTFWGNLDNHTLNEADLMSFETTMEDFVYGSNSFMTRKNQQNMAVYYRLLSKLLGHSILILLLFFSMARVLIMASCRHFMIKFRVLYHLRCLRML